MQTTELEKVKEKIHALSQKTVSNGCTEAEARNAMDKVGELLEAYQLNMSEVVLRNTECTMVTWHRNRKSRHPMDMAFVGVAAFCDCKVWVSKVWLEGKGMGKGYKLFGTVEDTKMAIYLMDVIAKAYKTELAKFKKTDTYKNSHQHGRVMTTNFYKSMAGSLHDRLLEMKAERDSRQRERQNLKKIADHKSTDLVVAKKKKVENKFNELGIRMRKSYGNDYRHDHNADKAGRKAGYNVNLNRPIRSGSKKNTAGYLT